MSVWRYWRDSPPNSADVPRCAGELRCDVILRHDKDRKQINCIKDGEPTRLLHPLVEGNHGPNGDNYFPARELSVWESRASTLPIK
jgi:hypothetical protein